MGRIEKLLIIALFCCGCASLTYNILSEQAPDELPTLHISKVYASDVHLQDVTLTAPVFFIGCTNAWLKNVQVDQCGYQLNWFIYVRWNPNFGSYLSKRPPFPRVNDDYFKTSTLRNVYLKGGDLTWERKLGKEYIWPINGPVAIEGVYLK